MKALIGRKIGMAQVYGERGRVTAVTLVQAGPCVVTQIRSDDKDGYSAMQLGFGESKKLNRAATGHLKATKPKSRVLREVRLEEASDVKVGDVFDVSQFEAGDTVKVTATSKGKGFAGTVKRHNFNTGPKTHGSDSYRRPGSIGSMYPQKIFKGKKMAGRLGHAQVTIKNLTVAEVDPEQNLIALTGAVPGPRKGIVLIRSQGSPVAAAAEGAGDQPAAAAASEPAKEATNG